MAISPVRDDSGRHAGGDSAPGMIRFLPMLLPVAILLLALILPRFLFQTDQRPGSIGLGPGAWPRAMLVAMAAFTALWIARDFWAMGRTHRPSTLRIPQEEGHYHFGKALVGLVLIVAYGWLLPILGFALATTLFIATWCLFSGMRNLVVIVPVTLIGTVALLWLFMGLALMPLPRGAGMFGEFSIWLLRATGIY